MSESTLKFGCTTTGTWGVFNTVAEKHSAEIVQADDELGKAIEERAYSENKEVQIDGLVKAAQTLPAAGEILTLGTDTFLVKSSDVNQKNKENQTFSVGASHRDSSNLIPLT